MSIINLYNQDCMPALEKMKVNQYSLAIVDPPYNINISNDDRFGKSFCKAVTKRKNYIKKEWDNKQPDINYFNQLFRISKNQIIWGVNYYKHIDLTGGRIFWDKNTADGFTNSAGELAYKSFGICIDIIRYTWNGMLQENMKNKQQRIHPTEKPIALYKWLLKKYAKEGDTILDTHGGSMSIVIACIEMGYSIDCYEIDKDYFNDAVKRIQIHISQGNLFMEKPELKLFK